MHGIIHAELKKYVETKFGPENWKAVLDEAGFNGKVYTTFSTYPDTEAVEIVSAASRLTKFAIPDILEDFGKFITPDLMNMYRSIIKSDWDMFDMLLQTEEMIHKVVRIQNEGAEPPRLKFERIDDKTLKFVYDSQRKMSDVAKGIIKGVADHYNEDIEMQTSQNPDQSVEIIIKRR